MSKYTTELRFLINTCLGKETPISVSEIREDCRNAAPLILGDYPIFNEEYRDTLGEKILYHFYFREIGFETAFLFEQKINEKLNLIMPYYNKLYESELLKFNPLEDASETIEHEEHYTNTDRSDRKDSSSTTVQSDTSNVQKYSDTPQGSIDNLKQDRYLTNATIDSSDVNQVTGVISSSGADSKGTNDGNYTTKRSGKSGSNTFSAMLKEYRETFLNIDQMIMAELEPLFMQLW